MIAIVTALHCEAKPIIDHFGLKKDAQSHQFEVFLSDEYLLLISGVGKIKAAIGTTYLLARYFSD
ncbi:MAG: hypothetical protein KDD53_12250, partial [Bdellovibrionales bacterium]|nr:hypothetical protein [Bdellovibrionales bacterium]